MDYEDRQYFLRKIERHYSSLRDALNCDYDSWFDSDKVLTQAELLLAALNRLCEELQ